jgi:hypothetical protein
VVGPDAVETLPPPSSSGTARASHCDVLVVR